MQSRRLIFVLANLAGGGAQRVVLTLLWELAERGYDLTLFLFKREGVYWNELHPKVRVRSVLEAGERTRDHVPRVLSHLLDEVARHDLVVGGLEGWPTLLGYLAARRHGKPCVGWVHIDLRQYPSYRNSWLLRRLIFFVYPRLDRVVFVSDGARQSALRWMSPADRERWRVIYNAVRVKRVITSRSRADSPTGPLHVIAVGRLTAQKGFDLLIEAHAQLIDEGSSHVLTILGEGIERRRLEELAVRFEVTETVRMPGFVTDVDAWYENADLFVLSSRFEGFGLVIVEAMLRGVPVVSTDCPSGPREILENGKYGEIVRTEDAGSLAAGMRRVLTDTVYRRRLSELGPSRAAEFSPTLLCDKWAELIAELLH